MPPKDELKKPKPKPDNTGTGIQEETNTNQPRPKIPSSGSNGQPPRKVWTPATEFGGSATANTGVFQLNVADAMTHPYAPGYLGSYYVKIPMNPEFDTAFVPTIGGKYVSVSFIAALARAEINWVVNDAKPAKATSEDNKRSAEVIQAERVFLGDMKNQWQTPRQQDIDKSGAAKVKRPKVWFRTNSGAVAIDGALATLTTKLKDAVVLSKMWLNMLQEIFVQIRVGGRKPPRWAEISLKKPLCVIFKPNLPVLTENLVKECVEKVNNLVRSGKAEWTVQVAKDKPDGYIALSSNPFGFYDSFVAQSDWEAYMKSLSDPMGSAIRGFGTSVVNTKTVESQLESAQKKVADASNTRLKNDPTRKKLCETAKKDHTRRNDHVFDVHDVQLTAGKIKQAVDKRTGEDNQNKVMGGHSASDVASDILKWTNYRPPGAATALNTNQMINWLYMAEWLHLSAFSWGGLLDDDLLNNPTKKDRPVYATSQIPENLVLGTSETNSLMTRYETAWQNFFLAECEFNPKVAGKLNITCNDAKNPFLHDHKDGVKYSRLPQSLGPGTTAGVVDMGRPLGKVPVAALLKLAGICGFLAYTVHYVIEITTTCHLMDDKIKKCEVTFYPFSRPFFHRAEAALDDRLFDLCKQAARATPRQAQPSGGSHRRARVSSLQLNVERDDDSQAGEAGGEDLQEGQPDSDVDVVGHVDIGTPPDGGSPLLGGGMTEAGTLPADLDLDRLELSEAEDAVAALEAEF
ncbi:hypothetical protein QBC47DRAFT_415082 [Echria macrotheca]|uniref:Uncharacterized protein n=1 Tax=Echria macrotheca TaxID=438768 RepID=A0AAJ0BAG6_9PEZI|nr:hypothetical protein QBC47DRAFT_415082 [Echria macrotheca]